MKRQCTDPHTHTNATAAMFSNDNNHQFLNYNNMTSPLTNLTRLIQPDSKPNNNSSSDGASVETQRRPRGRPPGSKNKVKSNNLTRIQPNNYQHIILEIPNGADVIDAITNYTLRYNVSLRIHSASGLVSNVSIRQPNSQHLSSTLRGQYGILSLTALFLTPTQMVPVMGAFNDVCITFALKGCNVVGGVVVGPLVASGSVFVFAERVLNLEYCRLGLVVEEVVERAENGGAISTGGNGDENGSDNNVEYGVNVGSYSPASFMPY